MTASRYAHSAQKAHRLAMKEHPEQFNCDCGRPGFIRKSGEIVCKRCHEWELAVWATNGEHRGYAAKAITV
jgi:Zn finger protein HypA/HybF involved in hydrogenase expression